ncbi:apolipoprotein N-acyltransferase, partial [Paenirhodobacter enshiensis]|uniref:apolipoprotein N-acyltransferase n=1 Tax=Paenirhodobacter enshiensis TaxID=1105367 RepID=UPI003FA26368
MTAHAQLLEKRTQGRIDVYFAGDSIARRWGATDYPQFLANWTENFRGWHAANFAWGADRTQNILWRLQNGELDGVNPKVIVLLAEPPAAGKPGPDLVIWPETAVPFLLANPGDGLNMIAEAAGGVPVALGIQRSEGERYYNSLVVLGPDARVEDLYDKSHLVPFGEYIPWGDELSRFGISAFAARTGNGYTPGAGETVLDLGRLGKVEPLICYEAVFPQDIRRVPERPDWIMQVTNDAWFGNLSGPWQHMALSRLRAIEFGLPVARAANTGVSVMIDARGEVTAELGMNQQGVIDAALPPALPETFYARWGDLPPIAAIVVLAFIILSWPRHYGVDRSFRQV